MPERDAVREHADLEYLVKLLELHDGTHTHIGITQPVAHAAARSIRALLSRAQPEGAAVAWLVVEDTGRKMEAHLTPEAAKRHASAAHAMNPAHDYAEQPLYTRPAPVVTEAMERVMQGYAEAYPVDVWPETPFTDAQAASVMRLMVPRIRESLTAALAAARGEGA